MSSSPSGARRSRRCSAVRARLTRLLSDQRLAYLLVGGTNTVLGLGWFIGLHDSLGSRLPYMAVLVIAYGLSMASGFLLHRRFVFKVQGSVWTDLGRFVSVNSAGLGLNALLLPAFVEIGHVPVPAAQVVATGSVAFLSFFGHRNFSFRRSVLDPIDTGARARPDFAASDQD